MTDFWRAKRVLVTGASSGIGAALARELARAGATVGMCARRSELLDDVLAECRASSPGSPAWTIDLAELDALEDFATRVESELGPIDVLVNNAGGGGHAPAIDGAWADLERILLLNYLSPVRLTRGFVPRLLEHGGGAVVTISSMAARMAPPGESSYAAAKAALSAWFESLAAELDGTPVSVHLVYPALIEVGDDRADGDDAMATSGDGSARIPAPVCARAVMAQVERGDLELYVPTTMGPLVARRAKDVAGTVAFFADLHRRGALP